MKVKELLEKLRKDCEEYEREHSFAFNSREEFAIPKRKVERAIKGLSYDPLTEKECKETLGRKWKVNVKNICILYNFLKHNKFYAEYSPVMISTTLCYTIKKWKTKDGKKVGTPVFRSPTDIMRIIQNMIDLKCCKCVDSKYGVEIKKGKIYVLSDARIVSLFGILNKQTFEEINVNKGEEVNINKDVNICSEYEYELELNNVKDCDKQYVCDMYDELKLNELTKSVNRHLQKQFQYRMTGWRPSADICYLPSKEKEHKRKHDIYREDVIPFEYKEYDRNASIYNLQLFLGKGIIRENDREKFDFYKEFSKRLMCIEFGHIIRYDDLNKQTFEEINVNKEKEVNVNINMDICSRYDVVNVNKCVNVNKGSEWSVNRNCVKVLMMSIQFADMRQIGALCDDFLNYLMTGDKRCFKKARKFRERAEAVFHLLGLENFNIETSEDYSKLGKVFKHFLRQARELLQEYLGISLGKEVFLYEAAVNLKCQNLIQEAGYNCITVYDGFFTNCSEELWWDCYKKSLYYVKGEKNERE